jgi:transcriptional regulator with XRE-family HTH domain
MTMFHISTTPMQAVVTGLSTKSAVPAKNRKPLNRIREVRMKQEVSLRTVARNMHIEMKEIRAQEDETADLRLSDLYRWQQVLDVPVSELLVESNDPLSRPVMERAQMVRIMKTAQALQEKANTPALQRMSQMLIDQLVQLMPELAGVTAWHSVGQRRSPEEIGRTGEQPVTFAVFSHDE